jgi:cytochrome c biogenesis protein CcdA/thiol-disulfide isomerase/thioredoxin
VATLAAVAGGWAVAANQYGRVAAIVLLALFGLALLFPGLADRLARPLVALGARLSQSADAGAGTSIVLPSLLLGVATGLLWAPCAGPVLGLVLTGAALEGANVETSLLLLAYAAGAATSLALAILVGGRVFAMMKRSLGVGEWIRRGLGVAVLAAVVAIALGLDTGFLTQVSVAGTASLEQGLLDRLRSPTKVAETQPKPSVVMTGGPAMKMQAKPSAQAEALPVEGGLPPLALSGAVEWLNSLPLTVEGLKGKVVLIDFWTYSCINCLRALPYIRAWAQKYKDDGLVVIGVHAPEFAFEKNIDNVRSAVSSLKIDYPVAIDNNYAIWRAFGNQYWPAHYFVDGQGRIRHHHFGEGDYDESEHVIQQLLAEAGKADVPASLVKVSATGSEAASDFSDVQSPETYLGYDRAENFLSPGGAVRNAPHLYSVAEPRLNGWGLSGDWTIGAEHAALNQKDGSIVYRFHARDLHLVLGPSPTGEPVRFRVTIDGAAPGSNHGTDVDADGYGVITGQRLYQLVRQNGAIADHVFEIQFLDPGAQAYAFTFG